MKTRCDIYSLKRLLSNLTEKFPGIVEIYMFGSRRHRTRSTRSDMDLLLVAGQEVLAEDVRDFVLSVCPVLDCFLVERGVATSCANGSKVRGRSKNDLIYRLDAIKIWDCKSGFTNADVDWDFEVIKGFTPIFTSLVSEFPVPSKSEAIATNVPDETEAHGRSRWRDISTHPITIIVATGVIIASCVFAVIRETRIIPLEKQIESLQQKIEALEGAHQKSDQAKSIQE